MRPSPARPSRAPSRTSASAPPNAEPVQVFHVVFAPNDIRQVTLDQLDDCYRLGLIDESTRVWTDGMGRWQTLAEAAGLDQPEPARPAPATSQRPPPPRRPHSAAPPARAVAPSKPPLPRNRTNAQASQRPIATSPSVSPARGSAAPAQASRPSASYRPSATVHTTPAPPTSIQHAAAQHAAAQHAAAQHAAAQHAAAQHAAAQQALKAAALQRAPAPRAPAPLVGPVGAVATQSFAPTAREPIDSNPLVAHKARLRGRVQAALFGACLLSGSVITLYRTDVLLQAARAVNQEATFLELERRWFGGAPLGTPRQVQGLSPAPQSTPATDLLAPPAPTSANVPPEPAVPSALASSPSPTTDPNAAPSDGTDPAALAARADQGAEASPRPVRGSRSAAPDPEALPKTVNASLRDTGAAAGARDRQVVAKSERRAPARAKSTEAQTPQPAAPLPAPGTDDFLRMSMRDAVKSSQAPAAAPAKRQRSKASGYDPLDGDL